MELIEALKIKKGKFDIPDCSRDDLPKLFVQLGYKVGAEIGVFKGRFSAKLLASGLKVYSVDPYLAYDEFNDRRLPLDVLQKEMDGYHKVAQWRLKRYRHSTLVRKTSMDASKDFADGSLDFVYIDGCHRFRYIAEDLAEWSKKVRSGGIVSGHDYYLNLQRWPCHVKPVVDAFIETYDIKNLYILGSEDIKDGEIRDRYRSWMWVNP